MMMIDITDNTQVGLGAAQHVAAAPLSRHALGEIAADLAHIQRMLEFGSCGVQSYTTTIPLNL